MATPLDQQSFAQLIQSFSGVVDRYDAVATRLENLGVSAVTGTTTGTSSGGGSGTPLDFASLPLGGSADINLDQAQILARGKTGGEVKRFPAFTFYSKAIRDMAPITEFTGLEILPAIGGNGLEGKIALAEFSRLFAGGFINPKLAPYNAKGDGKDVRDAVATANSKIVQSPTAGFRSDDVGKLAFLSNVGPNYNVLKTKIVKVNSATEVELANAPAVSQKVQMVWGTDDTAALRAALADARFRPGMGDSGAFVYGGCVLLPPGQYLTGPLVFYGRQAFRGQGSSQSILVRIPDGTNRPLLTNFDQNVDFPIIGELGLHGAKYIQDYNYLNHNFLWYSADGSVNLAQVDPVPNFSRIRCWEASSTGMIFLNRHAGTMVDIEVNGSNFLGIDLRCYDANISEIQSGGNGQAGLRVGGSNCNIANVKLSYNGSSGGTSQMASTAAWVDGYGNQCSVWRLQETQGSSLVFGSPANGKNGFGPGAKNTFTSVAFDDTSGLSAPRTTDHSKLLPYRAAVAYIGDACRDNRFFDLKVGNAVHRTSFLTHTVFFEKATDGTTPKFNTGRMFTDSDVAYFQDATTPTPPSPIGPSGQSPGTTIDPSNQITINGQSIV